MSREAMKLALEALEYIANETYDPWTNGAEAGRIAQTTLSKIKNKCRAIQTSDQMTCECGNVWDMNDPYPPKCTALREALAKPDFWEGYVPEPNSTCSNALRIQHKPYPRTCKKCGLGPCVELAQQALDKKAENAKELGLDYEPAQQEPVKAMHIGFDWLDNKQLVATYAVPVATNLYAPDLYTTPQAQPAQQEPEIVRLKEANQAMLEALKQIKERLAAAPMYVMYASEVFDSYYQSIINAAIVKGDNT